MKSLPPLSEMERIEQTLLVEKLDEMATCKIYRKKNLNGSTCDIFLCSNGRKE